MNTGVSLLLRYLGALFSQISTAKGDNIPPQIDDGKDGPVAENIIITAPLALIGQVGRQQLLFGVAQLFHGIGQAVPALAGVADAKVGDGRLGQPSPDEVSPAGPPRSSGCGGSSGRHPGLAQYSFFSAGRAVISRLLRHLHPGPLGQKADGLHVVRFSIRRIKLMTSPPAPQPKQ